MAGGGVRRTEKWHESVRRGAGARPCSGRSPALCAGGEARSTATKQKGVGLMASLGVHAARGTVHRAGGK